jgi:uncharacterized protein YcfJ
MKKEKKSINKFSMISGDYANQLNIYKNGAMYGAIAGGLMAIVFIKKYYIGSIIAGAIAGGYIATKIEEPKKIF